MELLCWMPPPAQHTRIWTQKRWWYSPGRLCYCHWPGSPEAQTCSKEEWEGGETRKHSNKSPNKHKQKKTLKGTSSVCYGPLCNLGHAQGILQPPLDPKTLEYRNHSPKLNVVHIPDWAETLDNWLLTNHHKREAANFQARPKKSKFHCHMHSISNSNYSSDTYLFHSTPIFSTFFSLFSPIPCNLMRKKTAMFTLYCTL